MSDLIQLFLDGNPQIIDISQPVASSTSCFPGDSRFSFRQKLNCENKDSVNLTTFTMSPHIGSHTEVPAHIQGGLNKKNSVGNLPLTPYIGPCQVIDLSPCKSEIKPEAILSKTNLLEKKTQRILFKTNRHQYNSVFPNEFAYFSEDLIDFLKRKECLLVGIDTPSVDHQSSKDLPAHHALCQRNMYWLENLDLSNVEEGVYLLVAFPLKFMELEASPVRAVLIKEK
jgi:arylformamidase